MLQVILCLQKSNRTVRVESQVQTHFITRLRLFRKAISILLNAELDLILRFLSNLHLNDSFSFNISMLIVSF